MTTGRSWKERVYRASPPFSPLPSPIRERIFFRDKYRCQVCEGRIHLSVHHVIPRLEGGSDDEQNLITLCSKCHDEVEVSGYRSVPEIIGHDPYWKSSKPMKHKLQPDPEDDPTDWRRWVYGGYRHPR